MVEKDLSGFCVILRDCGENALYAVKPDRKGAPVSLPISQLFIRPVPAKVLYRAVQ